MQLASLGLRTSVTLLATVVWFGPQSALATGGHPTSGIDWAPCGPDFPGVECATVRVPLNYDKPNGRKITLALARVPSSQPDHKIGTVFLNPGGPGGSGVSLVQFGFGQALEQLLEGRFDVVGFDPRGIGASTPIQCFDTNDELFAFLDGQPVYPQTEEEARTFFDQYNEYARNCVRRRQPILRHMSTADVARDLDFLREAVGDDKLTYLGFSYGSYIGSTYANLFPYRVRALVIDGVLNPQLWSSGLQIISDRFAAQEVFAEFIRLCDEAGPNCGLSGPDGAEANYEALEAAIQAAPIPLGEDFLYTYDLLIADTVGVMYSPSVWPALADFLGALVGAVSGDTAAAERAAVAHRSLLARMEQLTLPREEEPYNNGLDAFFGNHCADAQYPRRFADFLRFDAFSERGSRFGPFWWWGTAAGCARWPVNKNRYDGPWITETSSPVLVVGNFFDPATAYDTALSTAAMLTNSRLLSYAGWGHTAFGASECVTNHVLAYLSDQTLPPNNTVCPANPSPFTPVETGVGVAAAGAAPAALTVPMITVPMVRPTVPRPGR